MAELSSFTRILSFWTVLTVVQGFNMDLNAPVLQNISDTSSYFGFSVTMHRHDGENM